MSEQPQKEGSTPRRAKLKSLADVRHEMARIYREARFGKLDASVATRLTFILKEIRCCLEAEMLQCIEQRVDEIVNRVSANAAGRQRDQREGISLQ